MQEQQVQVESPLTPVVLRRMLLCITSEIEFNDHVYDRYLLSVCIKECILNAYNLVKNVQF